MLWQGDAIGHSDPSINLPTPPPTSSAFAPQNKISFFHLSNHVANARRLLAVYAPDVIEKLNSDVLRDLVP